MIAPATSIHTGTINGVPVRFFRGPGEGPDMPWHAHDDLLAAFRFPRDFRRVLRAKLMKLWGTSCHTVEVDGEPVLIATHCVAQGLIGAAREAGQGIAPSPAIVERDYIRAGTAALGVLTAGLPPSDSIRFAVASFHSRGGDAP